MAAKGAVAICPQCGYQLEQERSPLVLPYRAILNDKFLVGRVLGKPGGFGITYLAWDQTLETPVAIKEFLPGRTVSRDPGSSTVIPNSADDKPVFEKGLQVFLNEARTLVKFNHPNIVRVREYFSQNNTAYFVMDYYHGVSLSEYVRRHGSGLAPKPALAILLPMLAGLEVVHRQGYLHRDIKPGNIYLTANGNPILLDFGAARQVLGEETMSLSVVLTGGYAPYEQYHRKGKQGPWTDVYACGATLYFMLTGERPPDAIERGEDDQLAWPDDVNSAISPELSFAVMKALELQVADRLQSVAEFRALLTGPAQVVGVPAPSITDDYHEGSTSVASNDWATTTERDTGPSTNATVHGLAGWIVAMVLLVTGLAVYFWPGQDNEIQSVDLPAAMDLTKERPELVAPAPEHVDVPPPSASGPQLARPDDQRLMPPPPPPGTVSERLATPREFESRPPPREESGPLAEGFPRPPPHAIRACEGKQSGARCQMQTPRGIVPGVCREVPAAFACVPEFGPRPPPR